MPKTPSSRRIFRERLKLFAGPNHLYYNKDRLRLLQVEPRNIEMEESCGYFQDPVEYPMHKIKENRSCAAGVEVISDLCTILFNTVYSNDYLCIIDYIYIYCKHFAQRLFAKLRLFRLEMPAHLQGSSCHCLGQLSTKRLVLICKCYYWTVSWTAPLYRHVWGSTLDSVACWSFCCRLQLLLPLL